MSCFYYFQKLKNALVLHVYLYSSDRPGYDHLFKFLYKFVWGGIQTLEQVILKGEVSLYRWPPVWLVWISLFTK